MLTIIERARRYAAKCPPAVSGQGGHDATYHVAACLVHGFALGELDALAVLGEYNRSCVPPWSDRELRHKIESVGRADFREPRGCLLGSGVVVGPQRRFVPRSVPAAKSASPVKAAESFLKGFRCDEAELFEASPVKPVDEAKLDGAVLGRRLKRVREQLDRLDLMLSKETDPQKLDRIASAQSRLAEQERIYARKPLPGSLRPTSAKSPKSNLLAPAPTAESEQRGDVEQE